jgi:hypothetical protein
MTLRKILAVALFLTIADPAAGVDCRAIKTRDACNWTPGCKFFIACILLPRTATPADLERRDRLEREMSGCFPRRFGAPVPR